LLGLSTGVGGGGRGGKNKSELRIRFINHPAVSVRIVKIGSAAPACPTEVADFQTALAQALVKAFSSTLRKLVLMAHCAQHCASLC